MKITRNIRTWLVCAVICSRFASSVQADIIYDNTTTDLNTRFNPGTNQVGDEIVLAGSMRYLTNFSFEYWGTNLLGGSLFSGSVTAEVKFYLNDGTPFNGYNTPMSMFFDSGPFTVNPTERSTVVFSSPGGDFPYAGLFMPVVSNMTWSVQFSGMGPNDQVGVDLFSPPGTGGNFADYWENDAGTWTLKTNAMPVDFAAQMSATVPEPSALGLVALGAPMLLLAYRMRSKR